MTIDFTVRHLYVHVPFCPTICPFCSFHVVERRDAAVQDYLARIETELDELAGSVALLPDTVYFGGGTPSYLKPAEIEQLVAIIDQKVGWARQEATIEVHPSTATRERVDQWVALGFNRLSVGVQSFDDETLRYLDRPHSAATALEVCGWCVDSGAIVSVDLIVAVPGQDVACDVRAAIAAGVDHVSCYTLTIEDGTPFGDAGVLISEDEEIDSMRTCVELLGAAGFERYEVSNFAAPGARCRHNEGYWKQHWSAGIGPSASGFLPTSQGAIRSTNPHLAQWLRGAPADADPLSPVELVADAMFCGLRRLDGVDLDAVTARCGIDPVIAFANIFDDLVTRGWLEVDTRSGGRVARATPSGLLMLDRVMGDFLEPPSGVTAALGFVTLQ